MLQACGLGSSQKTRSDEAWLPSESGARACALSRVCLLSPLSRALSLSLAPSHSLTLSQGAQRVLCLDTRMARMYPPPEEPVVPREVIQANRTKTFLKDLYGLGDVSAR